jgi:hypothetical protein
VRTFHGQGDQGGIDCPLSADDGRTAAHLRPGYNICPTDPVDLVTTEPRVDRRARPAPYDPFWSRQIRIADLYVLTPCNDHDRALDPHFRPSQLTFLHWTDRPSRVIRRGDQLHARAIFSLTSDTPDNTKFVSLFPPAGVSALI